MRLRNHVSLRISFSINSPNTTAARTSPITEALASPIWNILSQLYFKQTNRDFSDTSTFSEIETAQLSPTKKRKNQYQDIGAESRKKRILCQRSTDKYRDLEEGMKSYIQGMFKSSFTALGLEVRVLIEDRFTKLEQTILSSQTPVGVPAYTHGAAPAYTQTHGAAPAYTQTHGAAPAYIHTAAAATTSTQAPGSDSTLAPTPTPASTHTSAPATTSRARASRNKASVPSHTGGPATAAMTRSQTKDPELSDVFGSLFDTLDFNLGTQEHLQKTMGSLTQESHVKGFDPSQEIFNRPFLNDIDDPEVRCKDSNYELVFVPEDKFSKLTEWILKPKVLQIGPSKFDVELASRIMGPNEWLKNNQRNCNDQFVNIFSSFSSNLYSWCAYKMLVWRGHNHIARVAHEMKHKLKIEIVALVVAGAIVGIWTSLSSKSCRETY
ncbi:hypothetical protein HID58_087588 [Brassica napus]|uniref:Uncharacterized protein n=1 Tax=Brassica napus TaxID=3708 RepID=A0ABQ7XTT9_BRANA|nr:hypothetical protein HID58_087588 [Brassica napus]